MKLSDYEMGSGKINIGRILEDAGVKNVNAAVYAAYQRGEFAVAPEFAALIAEAEPINAEIERRLAAIQARVDAQPRLDHVYRSEWEIRDGTAE